MKTYFLNGAWNVVCDVCGLRFKSVDIVRRWDGAMTCRKCYEPRHPQDFIRVRDERISVPFSRPEADVFVPQNTSVLISDSVFTDESLTRILQYIRRIPNTSEPLEPLVPLNRPLNTFAFNEDPLGGAGMPEGLTDEVIRSVDALAVRPTKPFSDSQSFSETLMAVSGKGIMDSQTISEAITYSRPTPFVLDGATFNSGAL